jgi:hypothetical protein
MGALAELGNPEHQTPATTQSALNMTKILSLPFRPSIQELGTIDALCKGEYGVSAYQSGNSCHPVLHAERAIAEDICVVAVRRDHTYTGLILDVGGSVTRHERYSRTDIHSLCPSLTGQDVIRNMKYDQLLVGYSWCKNVLGRCRCKTQSTTAPLIFIHSLYYFTQAEIAYHIQNRGYAMAAVHNFKLGTSHWYGSMNSPEASVYVKEDQVIMQVRGCAYSYSHPNPLWLTQSNSYRVLTASGLLCLTWNLFRELGQTRIYEFRAIYAPTDGPQVPLGAFPLYNDKITESTVFQMTILPDGSSVPLAFVEEMVTKSIGMPKDEDTLLILVNYARSHLKFKNYGLELMGSSLLIAKVCKYALGMSMRIENTTSASYIGEFRLDSLDYRYRRMEIGFAKYYVSKLVYKLVSCCSSKSLITSTHQQANIAAISLLRPKPLRANCEVIVGVDSVKTRTLGLMRYGPTVREVQIGKFADCQENEIVALNQRLMNTDIHVPKPAAWRLFKMWLDQHIDTILPHTEIAPVSFALWNAKFPRARQLENSRAIANVKLSSSPEEIKLWCIRSSFVKIEPIIGNLEEKKPRLIQSISAEANVILGPWMRAFQNYLKTVWTMDNDLAFGSGFPMDVLGSWMDKQPGGYYYCNDFSDCDGSFNQQALAMEQSIYLRFGIRGKALRVLKHQLDTRGRTRHNVYYHIRGVRCSGDPNTTCGNSMICLLALVFCVLRSLRGDACVSLRPDWVGRGIGCGDDTNIQSKLILNVGLVTQYMAELGFKAKLTHVPIHLVSFCSCWFLPTKVGSCMTPKLGKSIVKLGYAAMPQRNSVAWLKGNCVQWLTIFSHVEFMVLYATRLIELCGTIEAQFDKTKVVNFPSVVQKQSLETLVVLNLIYDITDDDIRSFILYLRQIRLDTHLEHPLITKLLVTEGLLN